MTGGTHATGHLRDVMNIDDAHDVYVDEAHPAAADTAFPTNRWPVVAATIAWLGAAAWLTVIGIANSAVLTNGVTVQTATQFIRDASPPLILIVSLYLVAIRGARSQSGRYRRLATLMRSEQDRLDDAAKRSTALIETETSRIAELTNHLTNVGDDAASRLKAVSSALAQDLDKSVHDGQTLYETVQSARADMSALLNDLPRARAQTLDLTTALDAAGLSAHQHAGALDAQMALLITRSHEAQETAGGAAQRLAAHLARVEGLSNAACGQLTDVAASTNQVVDATLERVAATVTAVRKSVDAQGAAMQALIEHGEAALRNTGAETAAAVAARVAEVTKRLETLGLLLDGHATTSHTAIDRITGALDLVDARFAAIDAAAGPRNERLGTRLGVLTANARDLTSAFGEGASAAEAMTTRATTLLAALDAISREVGDALPTALTRLDNQALVSRDKLTDLAPEISRVERLANEALDRLLEGEAVLARHRASLTDLATDAEDNLSRSSAAAQALVSGIDDADRRVREVADTTATTLVAALVRVRETAQVAAERAREAIDAIVPGSAARIATELKAVFDEKLSETITQQIDDLSTTAESAISAASNAADRLMRQMLTIAETSAEVEARIAEAQNIAEVADRDNFARRVALLIESLNSTAIDVTKILSNDVTDGTWGAYLKGDRGVFTRRAVRLLDAGEAREVARHYADDPEFRGQVNRYVHDFEAMLRNVLATRAGSPLGITLLSSDMGKLYVALAQAIERLRT